MQEPLPKESLPSVSQDNVSDKKLLSISNLSFSYENLDVLKDINLDVFAGEIVGLIGLSGSGKSTLLQLVADLMKKDNGTIFTDSRAAIVFQFPEYQIFDETILADVSFGPRNIALPNPEESAKNALQNMGIAQDFYERSPHTLSEGEKRRVGLAGILAMEPKILLLDEPFTTLDRDGRNRLANHIISLSKSGGCALLVSHNPEMLKGLCHRLVYLEDGKITDSPDSQDLK